jgi:death-on-curing protein
MDQPIFLTLEEVMELQAESIDQYGGLHGLRDRGLLESALAMPQAGFGGHYAHETTFNKAAAYLFHLTKNHPFIDGNKRIGLACAVVFLFLNGYKLTADNEFAAGFVLKVAAGNIDKEEIARFLEDNSEPIQV